MVTEAQRKSTREWKKRNPEKVAEQKRRARERKREQAEADRWPKW